MQYCRLRSLSREQLLVASESSPHNNSRLASQADTTESTTTEDFPVGNQCFRISEIRARSIRTTHRQLFRWPDDAGRNFRLFDPLKSQRLQSIKEESNAHSILHHPPYCIVSTEKKRSSLKVTWDSHSMKRTRIAYTTKIERQ